MEGEKKMEFENRSYEEYKYLQQLMQKYVGIDYLDLTAMHYIF